MPNGHTDFGIKPTDFEHLTLGGYVMRDDVTVSTQILMLRVEVEIDGALTSRESRAYTKAEIAEGHDILSNAAEVARTLVHKYIELVRANEHQHWLGMSIDAPRVTWLTLFLDDQGRRIHIGYNDPIKGSIFNRDAVSPVTHATFLRRAALGEDPPLAEIFLNDARHLAWSADHPDIRQAIVFAAIASELKVKQTLVRLARPTQRALVDLVLENPRDVSLAASSLFDKGLNAVCGRSLRVEDKELYKAVDHLFRDRNNVAHRGGRNLQTQHDLNIHVRTAGAVFAWLDELSTTSDLSSE